MKRVLLVMLLGLPVVPSVARVAIAEDPAKAGDANQKVSARDKKFVEEAAKGGMEEVALGQLAVDKTQNSEVKKFSQTMTDDHNKANEELKQIASQKGIAIPEAMAPEARHNQDRLTKLNGQKFDSEYMKLMVSEHKKDVAMFDRAAKNADDPDIKAFAAKTLPILQGHLDMAKTAEKMASR